MLCVESLMGRGSGKGHALPASDSASDSSNKFHVVYCSVLKGPHVS